MLVASPVPSSNIFSALDPAVAVIASQSDAADLARAVDRATQVMRLLGARPFGDDWDAIARELRIEILRQIAARMFPDSEDKQSSFVAGYLGFRSSDGADVPPLFVHDVSAWERGRDANPDYARHLAARKVADEAFRDRFQAPKPTTAKGVFFWRKRYIAAFDGMGTVKGKG